MSRTPPLLALFRRDRARTRIDEIIDFAPADGAREEVVLWFARLVEWLRPRDGQTIEARLRFFSARLERAPASRDRVSRTVTRLVAGTSLAALLVSGGIPHDFHFGGALKEWLFANLLPNACRTDDGAEVLRVALAEDDLGWLRQSQLVEVFATLVAAAEKDRARCALDDALIDLTHQIVAQVHLPAVRALAQSERSPFRGLYESVAGLVKEPRSEAAFAAVRGRVRQCVASVATHRAELADRGADLTTTFLLARSRQQLRRLQLLASLIHEPRTLPAALQEISSHVLRHARGHRLVEWSTDLITRNVIDTAANVGRGYLGEGTPSLRAAFSAGAGGGALMALATIVKVAIIALHLPVLYEGLASSVNYATVFCAAYLLHFTIATKLPAHTAATLARAAQDGPSFRGRLANFISVWQSALRLQIAGLIGNVAAVAPLAFLFAVGAKHLLHRDLLGPEEAHHIYASTSLLGPSVLYAALAGLFLWVSSLLGALADNWTRVVRVSDRLGTSRLWIERFGVLRARRYADRIVARWGGLVGNASLGFMLGTIPAGFAIAHLPVEIRHITVSTGLVALATATGAGGPSSIALAVLGLLAIAAANITVSFVLALWFAMRGVRSSPSSAAIASIGVRRWARGRSGVAAAGR